MTSDSDQTQRDARCDRISGPEGNERDVVLGSASDRLTAIYELTSSGSDFLFWLLVDRDGAVQQRGLIEGPEWMGSEHPSGHSNGNGDQNDAPGDVKKEPVSSANPRQVLSAICKGGDCEQAIATSVRAGGPGAFREVIDREGGQEVWQIRLGTPASIGGGVCRVLGVAKNVTDDVQRYEHLRETMYVYRRLIDMMPDAVSIIGRKGEFRYVNAAGAHLVGAAEIEDVLGKSYWDFVHPDDTDDLRSKADALQEGKPLDVAEYRLLRMDGSVVPVELASVPIKYNGEPAVLGTGRDLSALYGLQRELLLVSHAVESMDDPVAIFDPDGASIYHNPAFVRTIGYSVEELDVLGGMGVLFDVRDVADEVIASLQGGDPWRGDVELRTSSDTILRMALRANVVHTGEEQTAGFVCTFTDISDRHEMRKQLVAAKEEAEELARLRSAILTNLTHEVRTPLTVILGFTSMLRQGVKKKYMRFVDLIERSGRRLLLMLDAILDLAQLESGSLEVVEEPFNVVDVADGVVGTLQPMAKDKGIELHLEAGERSLPARLDHRVLARILNNLLDNAIKFTGEGSVRVMVEGDAEWVKISIRDTGVGIEQAFLPRMFDEFTQESTGLERTHQGSGLGLSVSERLVKHMGGSIEVESEKNVGTTFIVRLPANMDE